MARSRNIKPGFFINEVIAELPYETRLLFIGLWTLADREGRMEDRPKRIKGNLFPYDSFDIDPMLNELHDNGFLVRYEVDSINFIQITNFVKHQDPHYKEKVSVIPAPFGDEDLIKATNVTRSMRLAILKRDNNECQNCGSKDALCIDHVIPVSRGGDSSDKNLQVLCNSCNTKKGNKLDGEQKGFSKSKHNQQSIISRPDVNVNLTQNNHSSPSDSLNLIPDSLNLIPDSLIPEKTATAKAEKFVFVLPEWIDKQKWDLWQRTRKGKKMLPEQMQAQVDKLKKWKDAGMDYSLALAESADNGWTGLFEPKPKTPCRSHGFSKQPQERPVYTLQGNRGAIDSTAEVLHDSLRI